MRYEVSSKALYNQLLYFRGLWALDKKLPAAAAAAGVGAREGGKGAEGGKAKEGRKGEAEEDIVETEQEKINAAKEWNRERFQTCWAVVEAYLKCCGRVWVQMDELFRFALGT